MSMDSIDRFFFAWFGSQKQGIKTNHVNHVIYIQEQGEITKKKNLSPEKMTVKWTVCSFRENNHLAT